MATLKNNDIAYALHEATVGKTGKELDVVLNNAAKFLTRHRLIGKRLNLILDKLHNIQNKDAGVIEVKISSKNKLSHTSLNEIESFLKKYYRGETIHTEEEIDDSLIGGVKIQIGDDIIDLTLQNQLEQLQKYLLKS
ncbi:F0F1 ATP synthase subunit delta [Candidatus Nomurabacteria bacterium]|nr:F0F1 ATP synthase subunit delta [Candidatus Nomurabacteria bacterium]